MPNARPKNRRNAPRRQPALPNAGPATESLAGKIMWLRPREELERLSVSTELEDGVYDHPVVILSDQVRDGNVVVLLITSFGGTDLLLKHPHNREVRRHYLPIHPSRAHPDTGVLLRLENRESLKKNSYVSTRKKIIVVYDALRQYYRQRRVVRYSLESESFQELARAASFTPDRSPTQNTEGRAHCNLDLASASTPLIPAPTLPIPARAGIDSSVRGTALATNVNHTPLSSYGLTRATTVSRVDVRRDSLPLYHANWGQQETGGDSNNGPRWPVIATLLLSAVALVGTWKAWVHREVLFGVVVSGMRSTGYGGTNSVMITEVFGRRGDVTNWHGLLSTGWKLAKTIALGI